MLETHLRAFGRVFWDLTSICYLDNKCDPYIYENRTTVPKSYPHAPESSGESWEYDICHCNANDTMLRRSAQLLLVAENDHFEGSVD